MTPDAERLSYDTATPEQIAEVRERARAKLAEARTKHDAAYWQRLRERVGLSTRTS